MNNLLDEEDNQAKLNHFLIEHAPLINLYAKKLVSEGKIPKDIDPSDLHMAGFHGLMEALHRYDPKVGANFSTYAGHRIRGKMLDHAASQDAVPKTMRTQAKNVQKLSNPAPAPINPVKPVKPPTI